MAFRSHITTLKSHGHSRLELDIMLLPRAGLRVALIVMDQGLKPCTRDLETPEKDWVWDERDAARGQLRDRGKPLFH